MILCGPSAMHPYYCTHDRYCEHCTNAVTEWHDAAKCWLCCDGDPMSNQPRRFVDDRFAVRVRVYDLSHRKRRIVVRQVNQLGLRGIA